MIEEEYKPCSNLQETLNSSLVTWDEMENTFYLDYEQIYYCPFCGRLLEEIIIEEV